MLDSYHTRIFLTTKLGIIFFQLANPVLGRSLAGGRGVFRFLALLLLLGRRAKSSEVESFEAESTEAEAESSEVSEAPKAKPSEAETVEGAEGFSEMHGIVGTIRDSF